MAIINGTALDDVLITTAAVDTVNALGGNDVILIDAAADHAAGEIINGGTGNDRIWFTSGNATETLTLRSGVTNVESVEISDGVGNSTGTTALNINAGAVTTALTLIGNDGVNILTGTAKNDIITGSGGHDDIVGGAGNDRIVMDMDAAGNSVDTADGGAFAANENNTLVLKGIAAGRVELDLSVAAGEDQLTLVNGVNDALAQKNFSSVDASELQFDIAGGINVTGSAAANTLVGSAQNDVLEGGAGIDFLSGGGGNDVFLVGAGTHFVASETYEGGAGDDILRFTSIIDAQTLTLSAKVTGIETVEISNAAGDTTGATALKLNAAAVKVGLTLTGNDGVNTITGTAFNDVLNGNGGADSLVGGGGNDYYVVDSGADTIGGEKVTDTSGTADYIIFTSTTDADLLTLGATTGVEGVYLSDLLLDITGTATLNVNASAVKIGLSFFGNDGANELTGGTGNDIFTGNGGIDTIIGGAGNDTVYTDVGGIDIIDAGAAKEGNTLRLTGTAAGTVVVDLSVAAGVDQLTSIDGANEALVQSNFSHVDASALLDVGVRITGSSVTNTLIGSAQNDVFVVNDSKHFIALTETISGSEGNDTLRFASTIAAQKLTLTAKVTGLESAAIADADGITTGITALDLDAGKLANGLTLTGNDGKNTLTGTAFNDVLIGNEGNDTMIGGAGNDLYIYDQQSDDGIGLGDDHVGDGNDTINDTKGEKDFVVFTSETDADTLTLKNMSGIEAVYLTTLEAVYNIVDEKLDTTGATNLNVDATAVTIGLSFFGNDGDNVITGGTKDDVINGNGGDDTLYGGAGNDTLAGGEGNDTIYGGAGNDIINMDVTHPDTIDAGTVGTKESNTLVLTGDAGSGTVVITLGSRIVLDPDTKLPIAIVPDLAGGIVADADQMPDFVDLTPGVAGVQSDFNRVDASAMIGNAEFGGGIEFYGSKGNDTVIGSAQSDYFEPGLGNDVIEGGGGNDTWIINSLAEFTGDIYTDNGGTLGDYLYFDGQDGQTLKFSKDLVGIDVAQAGLGPSSTENININASAVNNSFSMSGNAGNNQLTGTVHGETIFDYGGKDDMRGGAGLDEYYIVAASDWVTGDKITDSGYNELTFEGTDDGVLLLNSSLNPNASALVSGIQLIVIADDDPGAIYRRDNTTDNPAGVDASGLKNAITLAGNDGANALTGTKFADAILGYGGSDVIVAGAGADTVTMQVEAITPETSSIDAIDAGLLTEGNALILTGLPAGIIEIDLSAADQITEINDVAEALIQSGFAHVDASGVTDFGVRIALSAQNNTLTGTSKDDVFVVGNILHYSSALDVIDGGAGNDTLWFDSPVAGKTFTLGAKTTSVETMAIADAAGSNDGTVALNINAGALKFAIKLIGNDGANTLTGGSADDTITGNNGVDTLNGGAGNDLFIYANSIEFRDPINDGDAVEKITAGAGTADTLQFTSTTVDEVLTLNKNVTGLEIVEINDIDPDATGDTALNIDASAVLTALIMRGNEGANIITGTVKNDTITGNGGFDVIFAGAGADVIFVQVFPAGLDSVDAGAIGEGNKLILNGEPGGIMVWDLTAGNQLVSVDGVAEVTHTFAGITHIDASAINNDGVTITGSAESNILVGTDFADTFIILSSVHFIAATETITAGTGLDKLIFASAIEGQTLTLTAKVTGIETAQISDAAGLTDGLTALSLNAATMANAMTLTGNDGNNTITGTKFADTITGNAGQDTINAGAGADIVHMEVSAGNLDAINAGAAGEGNSWVMSGAAGGAMIINLASTTDQLVSIDGVSEALKQTGFVHLDASAVTTAMTITGTTAANIITGGSEADLIDGGAGNDILIGGLGADTITGGLGKDTITMDASTTNIDTTDAGAADEGNTLLLVGSAAGLVTIDLSVGADQDQITQINGANDALVQSDFANVDASAMGGAGVNVTGSSAANYIFGTTASDTINAGAGADTVVMGVANFDTLDAGGGGEGDTLVLTGAAGGQVVIDLSVEGADQVVSVDGVAEAMMQTDFQNVNLSPLTGSGADIRGNDLNNVLTGSRLQDIFIGLGGADIIDMGTALGAGTAADTQGDVVVYESPADGWNGAAAVFSYDRIKHFESEIDKVRFTAQFNGGNNNLDDMNVEPLDEDVFNFANDVNADFSNTHEALIISDVLSKLTNDNQLTQSSFSAVVSVINKLGVTSVAGDDGLIVVQTTASTGIYYYLESDGVASKVSGAELTLLGVLDTVAFATDFALA